MSKLRWKQSRVLKVSDRCRISAKPEIFNSGLSSSVTCFHLYKLVSGPVSLVRVVVEVAWKTEEGMLEGQIEHLKEENVEL